MLMHNKFYYLAAGMVLAALPGWAGPPSKAAPKTAPVETVTIENTGSTNTTGYQIVVSSSGSASYREAGANGTALDNLAKPRIQALSKDVTAKLFTDLAAAGPLASLPARHGMRSVSFGTETYVTYKGQRSPDLTFPASPQAQSVRDDVMAITRTLHVANHARFPLSRPILP